MSPALLLAESKALVFARTKGRSSESNSLRHHCTVTMFANFTEFTIQNLASMRVAKIQTSSLHKCWYNTAARTQSHQAREKRKSSRACFNSDWYPALFHLYAYTIWELHGHDSFFQCTSISVMENVQTSVKVQHKNLKPQRSLKKQEAETGTIKSNARFNCTDMPLSLRIHSRTAIIM